MKRILNLSADETLLRTRSAILEQAGYAVTPVTNLHELVAQCTASGSEFALAIVGHSIPDEEKRRVMYYLREHCPSTSIIELFARERRAVDGEADLCISTLDGPKRLLGAIKKVLREETE